MADAENVIHPSKKRAAGREISRDNPGLDDDDERNSDQEIGTFKKASEDVLASRRIVKVRRNQTSSTQSAPPNPFAGVRFVPSPDTSSPASAVTAEANNRKTVATKDASGESTLEKNSDNKVLKSETDKSKKLESESNESKQLEVETDESKAEVNVEKIKHNGEAGPCHPGPVDEKDAAVDKVEDEARKNVERDNIEKEVSENAEPENENKESDGNQNAEKNEEAASFSSFQQLSSSQNAFTGLAGTGFSASSFSFGSIAKDGPLPSSVPGSLFGLKSDQPAFGFGISNNGSSSLFGTLSSSIAPNREGSGFPKMQEVSLETGEENEKPVFVADSVLFEFLDGGWKERGKGELKVNISTTGIGKARLVMRTRGNYRLILNSSLYPDIKLTDMDKRGITFACVNSAGEGTGGLSTFALKFKDASMVDEFRSCVMEHKGDNAVAALKTPENSPKASDD